jgi:hypothetical protein
MGRAVKTNQQMTERDQRVKRKINLRNLRARREKILKKAKTMMYKWRVVMIQLRKQISHLKPFHLLFVLSYSIFNKISSNLQF